jgi:hypothetical protein
MSGMEKCFQIEGRRPPGESRHRRDVNMRRIVNIKAYRPVVLRSYGSEQELVARRVSFR